MRGGGNEALRLAEHAHELIEVNLSIPVEVRLLDHLVHLLVRQVLSQRQHDVAELSGVNLSRTVFVLRQ